MVPSFFTKIYRSASSDGLLSQIGLFILSFFAAKVNSDVFTVRLVHNDSKAERSGGGLRAMKLSAPFVL